MIIRQTPVLLLTGYLGSGKTTLLNRILQNRQGIKFAVIVNDLGEVNIDASLIQQGGVVSQQDDSLVALQNGCICCTLRTDLIEQLHDIIASKRFDYIVIEASGICEPAPIAQTICSYEAVAPAYAKDGLPVVDSITTVVDALRMRDEFASGDSLKNEHLDEDDIENLIIQQIEFCNMILLNKASEVSKNELEHIHQIIRAIQPEAEIIECDYCDVPLDKLVGTGSFDFDRVAGSAAWIHGVESEIEDHHHDEDDDDDEYENNSSPKLGEVPNRSEEYEHHHDHHHPHHDHDHDHEEGEAEEYGISTFVYYARRPFSMSLFDNFVARHWPKEVIRAKGMCYFSSEYDTCYVFEQAGRQFQIKNAGQWYATMPKDELADLMEREPALVRDWDEEYGDRMQKLVFIGQKMNKEAIIESLNKCLE